MTMTRCAIVPFICLFTFACDGVRNDTFDDHVIIIPEPSDLCGGYNESTVAAAQLPSAHSLAPLVEASGTFDVDVRWSDGVEEVVSISLDVDENEVVHFTPNDASPVCGDYWRASVSWAASSPSGRANLSATGHARFGRALAVSTSLHEPDASNLLAAVGSDAAPPVSVYVTSDGASAVMLVQALESATADVDVEIATSSPATL